MLLALDGGDAIRLEDVTLGAAAVLRASYRSTLAIHAEQVGEEVPFRLTLRLQGDLLAGYASARFQSARGAFQVPAYVELRRVGR